MINTEKIRVKIYKVKGCKTTRGLIFNGYVCNINDEPIINSIRRKTGLDKLFCELTNEGFEYDEVTNPYSIPMSMLTLGDFMLINNNILI